MQRAIAHMKSGAWDESRRAGDVTLAFNDRHRRRLQMHDDAGAPFLLDLPTATRMADGDGLALEDGRIIRVRAAVEAVAELTCAGAGQTARLAWHIGNRHVPLEIVGDGRLRILDDHVIVAMAVGLGAAVERRQTPFSPETGAYEGGHDHAH